MHPRMLRLRTVSVGKCGCEHLYRREQIATVAGFDGGPLLGISRGSDFGCFLEADFRQQTDVTRLFVTSVCCHFWVP